MNITCRKIITASYGCSKYRINEPNNKGVRLHGVCMCVWYRYIRKVRTSGAIPAPTIDENTTGILRFLERWSLVDTWVVSAPRWSAVR